LHNQGTLSQLPEAASSAGFASRTSAMIMPRFMNAFICGA
jgi:hypothetical protein